MGSILQSSTPEAGARMQDLTPGGGGQRGATTAVRVSFALPRVATTVARSALRRLPRRFSAFACLAPIFSVTATRPSAVPSLAR
jgi:hypothetical protein